MNKALTISVMKYLILTIVLVYAVLEGSLLLHRYLNFEDSFKYKEITYLIGSIIYYLVALFSIVGLIIKIKRDLYKRNFDR